MWHTSVIIWSVDIFLRYGVVYHVTLEGYIQEDFPLVYHIVRYRLVALIFGEGKQSVELLAQRVEQALF